MKIVICGSVKESWGEMLRLAIVYQSADADNFVTLPEKFQEELMENEHIEAIGQYFEEIDTADLVVICRKPDGALANWTTYQKAYALYNGKNVIEHLPDLSQVVLPDEGEGGGTENE